MADDQSVQDVREAIGRGLSAYLTVERDAPDRLKALLRQLKLADENAQGSGRGDDR